MLIFRFWSNEDAYKIWKPFIKLFVQTSKHLPINDIDSVANLP